MTRRSLFKMLSAVFVVPLGVPLVGFSKKGEKRENPAIITKPFVSTTLFVVDSLKYLNGIKLGDYFCYFEDHNWNAINWKAINLDRGILTGRLFYNASVVFKDHKIIKNRFSSQNFIRRENFSNLIIKAGYDQDGLLFLEVFSA